MDAFPVRIYFVAAIAPLKERATTVFLTADANCTD
jgi:hypothetical protein